MSSPSSSAAGLSRCDTRAGKQKRERAAEDTMDGPPSLGSAPATIHDDNGSSSSDGGEYGVGSADATTRPYKKRLLNEARDLLALGSAGLSKELIRPLRQGYADGADASAPAMPPELHGSSTAPPGRSGSCPACAGTPRVRALLVGCHACSPCPRLGGFPPPPSPVSSHSRVARAS